MRGHQVPESGAALGRELVPGMAKIVQMQARHTDRLGRPRPDGHLVQAARFARRLPGVGGGLWPGSPVRRTPGHAAILPPSQHSSYGT